MNLLRDLLKITEGFDPDFHNMSDAELMDLCVELEMEDACELDDDGRIANREELIRDLEAGHGPVGKAYGDAADRDVPMEPREDEEHLDPVGHEDADINNDAKVDSTDRYLAHRRAVRARAMRMECAVLDADGKKVKTFDTKAQAEEYVKSQKGKKLTIKEAHIPVIKHKGKPMTNVRKKMNYMKPVKVKESEVVKFKQKADGGKKPALPAFGGKQGDVNNKPADKAIEDEIGDAGMKGMFKKNRPFPEKKRPTFKDWLTGNMVFDMTPSGPRAGDKMEGEKKDSKPLNELKLPSKLKRFAYGTAYETQPEDVIRTVKGMSDREVDTLHRGYEKEGDVKGRSRGSPADIQKRALRREHAKRRLALPEIDPKFKA